MAVPTKEAAIRSREMALKICVVKGMLKMGIMGMVQVVNPNLGLQTQIVNFRPTRNSGER